MTKKKIPQDVQSVVDSIVEEFSPNSIYLFSLKRKGVASTAGFKLCVVVESGNIAEIERKIYVDIDCEVSFDALVYSEKTWAEALSRENSFANRIKEAGLLVYEHTTTLQ